MAYFYLYIMYMDYIHGLAYYQYSPYIRSMKSGIRSYITLLRTYQHKLLAVCNNRNHNCLTHDTSSALNLLFLGLVFTRLIIYYVSCLGYADYVPPKCPFACTCLQNDEICMFISELLEWVFGQWKNSLQLQRSVYGMNVRCPSSTMFTNVNTAIYKDPY